MESDTPCEFIAKMISGTRGGIFVAKNTQATSGFAYLFELQGDGIHVTKNGTTDYGAVGGTTVPLWLKIRISGINVWDSRITFWYSTDGVNWTQYISGVLSEVVAMPGNPDYLIGLIARSSGAASVNQVYDWVKMIRVRGPARDDAPVYQADQDDGWAARQKVSVGAPRR
jgi:hypothetical protein